MRNAIGTPYTGLTEDQVHDLNIKLYDLIQSLEYNVDAPDLHNALQVNLGSVSYTHLTLPTKA